MEVDGLDDLYGLPLDRFVPKRRALAASLRAAGSRDEAGSVAALRRPSVAAWAVNQLVRTQSRAVRDLFAAGDALRDAQEQVLGGGASRGAAALRDAVDLERAAVGALVDLARGLLDAAGNDLSATTLERVADTLHAAAFDEDARAAVRDGRLERELQHAGFGLGGGLAAPAAPSAPPARRRAAGSRGSRTAARREPPARGRIGSATGCKPADADADRAAKRERADAERRERAEAERAERERRRAEAQHAERERAAAHREARAAEADARREAERAAKALRVAEERRERAQAALDEADDELTNARERAEAADEAHRQARERLDAT